MDSMKQEEKKKVCICCTVKKGEIEEAQKEIWREKLEKDRQILEQDIALKNREFQAKASNFPENGWEKEKDPYVSEPRWESENKMRRSGDKSSKRFLWILVFIFIAALAVILGVVFFRGQGETEDNGETIQTEQQNNEEENQEMIQETQEETEEETEEETQQESPVVHITYPSVIEDGTSETETQDRIIDMETSAWD